MFSEPDAEKGKDLEKAAVLTVAQRIAMLTGAAKSPPAERPAPQSPPRSVFKAKTSSEPSSPVGQPASDKAPVRRPKWSAATASDLKPLTDIKPASPPNEEAQYTRKVAVAAEKYVSGLSDEQRGALNLLAEGERRTRLKATVEELVKDLVPARPFWKGQAVNAAVDLANNIVTGKLSEEENMRAVGAELPSSCFLLPGPNNLYRNASAFLAPQTLLDQKMLRGRMEPGSPTSVIADLARIFADPKGAFAVVDGYVRKPSGSGGMTLSSGPEVATMSATTAKDNTLGNSPTWQYTFPGPSLSKVQPAEIQAALRVTDPEAPGGARRLTDEEASSLEGTAYDLQSNSGDIASAAIIAFVSTSSSKEHMFLTRLGIPADLGFRAYTGITATTYRTKWKRLNQANLDRYTALVEKKYGLQL